jgi:hypothetical protein
LLAGRAEVCRDLAKCDRRYRETPQCGRPPPKRAANHILQHVRGFLLLVNAMHKNDFGHGAILTLTQARGL